MLISKQGNAAGGLSHPYGSRDVLCIEQKNIPLDLYKFLAFKCFCWVKTFKSSHGKR